MTRNEHIGSSIFVLAASGAGFAYAMSRQAPSDLIIDPYFMPSIVLGLMFLLGLVRLYIGLKMPKTDEKSTLLRIPKKSLLSIVFIGLYAFLLDSIGFIITTFVFTMAEMYILQEEKKNWKMMIIIALVCSVGLYLMFSKVFTVMLPTGILTFI